MQITENSLRVNLNSKGNAMAVKVKREEEVSLTPRLRPFWCLSQSTTGSSQRNDIVDSSFQPGRALGAQSSKVQKLVLESWIPQRQKACIASIPISDLSQNWCSGLFNAWMNEWMAKCSLFSDYMLWGLLKHVPQSIWHSSHQEVQSMSPPLNLGSVAVWWVEYDGSTAMPASGLRT